MARILTSAAIKSIESAVDALFDKAKARYLGPHVPVDKKLFIGFKPHLSLPGIYQGSAAIEGNIPDADALKVLVGNANNYLDAYRSAAKAQVVKQVQAFLNEADLAGVKTDVATVLGGKLADTWGKVTNDVKRMVDTEASNARNAGALDGIIKVNASQGIEDPVIFFVVVRDAALCDECKRLHLLEDGVTPRVWYLSEVGHGYHKKGQDNPKLGGLHPHCRCTMVTLMPGYGFDGSGMVKFISPKHDEVKAQRGE